MMLKSQHGLDFDIWPISPRRRGDTVSATQYWIDLELPGCMTNLTMTQLTALRKMIVKAYNAGRKL